MKTPKNDPVAIVKCSIVGVRCRCRRYGQGIVEYAGALVIAGLIIGALINAAASGNWLNASYVAIFTACQTMLVNFAAGIGGG